MLDYVGIKCPVCQEPFREQDDIVVCPECGAPYHRACYAKAGTCLFTEELHGSGLDWEPQLPPEENEDAEEVSSAVKTRECPRCGALNDSHAAFCSRCGSFLVDEELPEFRAMDLREDDKPVTPLTPPFGYDPMGGVSPADAAPGDVSYGELSKVVRQNTIYYMPVFRGIAQTRRNRFNFCAFLFSGAWMLYRKQYRLGGLVTGLMLLLQAAFQLTYWLVSYPTLLQLMELAGIPGGADMVATLTNEDLMAMSAYAAAQPALFWRMASFMLPLILSFVLMLIIGILGNKLYLEHCVETVHKVRQESLDNEEEQLAYDRKGGVNSTILLGVMLFYFIIRTVLPMLLA